MEMTRLFFLQKLRSRSEVRVKEERFRVRKMADVQKSRKGVQGSQSVNNMGDTSVSHQVSSEDSVLYFWTTDFW